MILRDSFFKQIPPPRLAEGADVLTVTVAVAAAGDIDVRLPAAPEQLFAELRRRVQAARLKFNLPGGVPAN